MHSLCNLPSSYCTVLCYVMHVHTGRHDNAMMMMLKPIYQTKSNQLMYVRTVPTYPILPWWAFETEVGRKEDGGMEIWKFSCARKPMGTLAPVTMMTRMAVGVVVVVSE